MRVFGRHGGERRGTIYLEVIVSSVVFALTLVGMGANIVAQARMMRTVEDRIHVMTPAGAEVRVVPDTTREAPGLRVEAVTMESGGEPPRIQDAAHLFMTTRIPGVLRACRVIDPDDAEASGVVLGRQAPRIGEASRSEDVYATDGAVLGILEIKDMGALGTTIRVVRAEPDGG